MRKFLYLCAASLVAAYGLSGEPIRDPLSQAREAAQAGEVFKAAVLARQFWATGSASSREVLREFFASCRDDLVGALSDVNAEVRASAAWALAVGGAAELADKLAPLLEDTEAPVRRAAALALGELAGRELTGVLARAVGDAEPSVREAALKALRRLGVYTEEAVAALEDPSEVVRLAAAALLRDARAEGPELRAKASSALVRALSDRSALVRAAAASALGRSGSEEHIEALARASRDPEPAVGASAVEALGDIGFERAADALLAIAKDAGVRPAIRALATKAIGRARVRSHGVISVLSGLLREAPRPVARAAAEALSQIGGGEARAELLHAASSGRADVRASAAVAAARCGELKGVRSLLRDLDDPDEWTALLAARGLAELGNPAGFHIFIRALRSEDVYVSAYAAACLGIFTPLEVELFVGKDAASRAALVEGWERWWQENRETFTIPAN